MNSYNILWNTVKLLSLRRKILKAMTKNISDATTEINAATKPKTAPVTVTTALT